MKNCYNILKAYWDEHFATTPYTPAHMNSVLVDVWSMFFTTLFAYHFSCIYKKQDYTYSYHLHKLMIGLELDH